ncbi:DNA-directed RNA polymerase subunit alpha C-terminal domain-containing protein [Paenibacillus lactis]
MKTIEELGLSVRTYNVLKTNNIQQYKKKLHL